MTNQTCQWAQDSDGNYDTECGEMFTILEGTPSENNMNFCCYCGGSLDEVPYGYDDDTDDEGIGRRFE